MIDDDSLIEALKFADPELYHNPQKHLKMFVNRYSDNAFVYSKNGRLALSQSTEIHRKNKQVSSWFSTNDIKALCLELNKYKLLQFLEHCELNLSVLL